MFSAVLKLCIADVKNEGGRRGAGGGAGAALEAGFGGGGGAAFSGGGVAWAFVVDSAGFVDELTRLAEAEGLFLQRLVLLRFELILLAMPSCPICLLRCGCTPVVSAVVGATV